MLDLDWISNKVSHPGLTKFLRQRCVRSPHSAMHHLNCAAFSLLGSLSPWTQLSNAQPGPRERRSIGHLPLARHEDRLSFCGHHRTLLGHANAVRTVSLWWLQVDPLSLGPEEHPGSHSDRPRHDVLHQRLPLYGHLVQPDAEV